MKILKDKEYNDLKLKADRYDYFNQKKYWFSEYLFLNPIFSFICGTSSVDSARQDFRRLLREYIIDQEINLEKLVTENKVLRTRLGYYEDIILSYEANKAARAKDT